MSNRNSVWPLTTNQFGLVESGTTVKRKLVSRHPRSATARNRRVIRVDSPVQKQTQQKVFSALQKQTQHKVFSALKHHFIMGLKWLMFEVKADFRRVAF